MASHRRIETLERPTKETLFHRLTPEGGEVTVRVPRVSGDLFVETLAPDSSYFYRIAVGSLKLSVHGLKATARGRHAMSNVPFPDIDGRPVYDLAWPFDGQTVLDITESPLPAGIIVKPKTDNINPNNVGNGLLKGLLSIVESDLDPEKPSLVLTSMDGLAVYEPFEFNV